MSTCETVASLCLRCPEILSFIHRPNASAGRDSRASNMLTRNMQPTPTISDTIPVAPRRYPGPSATLQRLQRSREPTTETFQPRRRLISSGPLRFGSLDPRRGQARGRPLKPRQGRGVHTKGSSVKTGKTAQDEAVAFLRRQQQVQCRIHIPPRMRLAALLTQPPNRNTVFDGASWGFGAKLRYGQGDTGIAG